MLALLWLSARTIRARRALIREENEVAEGAVVRHAAALDTALAKTISEMNKRSRFLNRMRPAWKPSEDLAERLRRLAIGALY